MRFSNAFDAMRWLAAPAVLIAIAAYQVFLVQTTNLTPWKGGGFGMFSTDRNGAGRTVRVFLVRRDGDVARQLAVSPPPELSSLLTGLRQAPTTDRGRALARMLAVLRWQEPAELDAIAAGAPEELARQALAARDGSAPDRRLERLLTLPRAWVANAHSSRRHGEGRPITFDHVVIEVWETRYDADGPRLRSERLLETASESLTLLAGEGGRP